MRLPADKPAMLGSLPTAGSVCLSSFLFFDVMGNAPMAHSRRRLSDPATALAAFAVSLVVGEWVQHGETQPEPTGES